MNVDSIKLYSGFENKPKSVSSADTYGLMRENVEKCEKEISNRGYYGGSFTGKTEAAAKSFENLGKTFADKIGKSGYFQSLLRVFDEKSSVALALVSLIVAGGFRPVTNLAMAGKDDRDDSIYAASHAIASAVIGFIVSFIVMHPFDKAFKKIKDDPKKYLTGLEKVLDVPEIGRRKVEKSKTYKILSKAAHMGIDSILLGIPKAMLTIALIPVILKHVFHMEKGKKNNEAQNANTQVQDNSQYVKNLVKENPVFKTVKGGVQ
jgi:hypothetical protein